MSVFSYVDSSIIERTSDKKGGDVNVKCNITM